MVRPLVRRIVTPDGAGAARGAAIVGPTARVIGTVGRAASSMPADAGVGITGGGRQHHHGGGPNVSIVGGDQAVAISNRTSAMIDIAQVQGQVHAQSVQKVGELADKQPERNRRHHPQLAARNAA